MNKPPILLPNNTFGALIMLIVIALAFLVPFTVTAFVVGIFLPWWVNGPISLAVATLVFLKIVKFNQK